MLKICFLSHHGPLNPQKLFFKTLFRLKWSKKLKKISINVQPFSKASQCSYELGNLCTVTIRKRDLTGKKLI